MISVKRLDNYTDEIARDARKLLIELSRSGRDPGEIPESWFTEVISSPYHDLIMAVDDETGEVVGMATVSVTMGAGIRKNAFLEDFVVSEKVRGQGVGTMIWDEILRWAEENGAKNLEFTSGEGREAAWKFYQGKGAEIYKTNFFRKELDGRD